ncbi:MAG: ArsR family transcriptional regulator, partial [Caulobacterales bacterium RIFCSPHIGHO2_12_FULL_68_13]
LELLEHVSQGERSVDALARLSGLSLANASHHLKQLRMAGLVQARRSGKNVFYRRGEDTVEGVLSALRAHAEASSAEVRSIVADCFTRLDAMEPVPREVLLERLVQNDVILLDVRPEDEYRLGHIPGAWNAPLPELERMMAALPQGKEVVAYCRGPYCILSFEAVAFLRGKGFRALRLEDGLPEWQAAGFALESAA